MESPQERRIGPAAGPLVRPYALTGGRTRPQGIRLDLVTVLIATGAVSDEQARMSRHQRRLLELCRTPHTLADLTAEMNLPLGVVQVLLADLHRQGLVEEHREAPLAARPDPLLLKRVLDDLRAL
ncbi:DUF742 domain-containing protein [Actinomadura rudentiformis]|uniref:DUF742 domain-containing protein n=1 Tax=Actinomadura rudentiformis TaxID=359158 RepID=A0A6H9YBZ3_9ACTN|nr:DUF742 domain-containing protein [Actinomadura rudentiformis]KAB2341531.1 DUF742 domain-containing protein [Actinomadura rudentiformis]